MMQIFHKKKKKNDDVIQIHQAGAPLEAREDDVDGPLEGRWRVPKPEWPSKKPEGSRVRAEGRLVPIGLV